MEDYAKCWNVKARPHNARAIVTMIGLAIKHGIPCDTTIERKRLFRMSSGGKRMRSFNRMARKVGREAGERAAAYIDKINRECLGVK
jgi:hypothetical protein